MSDQGIVPPALNRLAVLGIAVSTVVAALALFALPTLLEAGVPFPVAFGAVALVEFVSALGVVVSVLDLYEERPGP